MDDPAAPPPPPKTPFFSPRFWTGFGFGVLAFLFLAFAGLVALTLWFRSYAGKVSRDGGADAFLSAPPFPAAGTTAEYGLSLETIDGASYDASTLKGRTVFLNYWATWCAPCRAEMPSIERLRAKTWDLDVVFLLVSEEKSSAISAFLSKNPLALPVFRSRTSRPPAYRSDAIPATFILSADGRIAFRHTGAARWDDPSAIAFLRNLPGSSPIKP